MSSNSVDSNYGHIESLVHSYSGLHTGEIGNKFVVSEQEIKDATGNVFFIPTEAPDIARGIMREYMTDREIKEIECYQKTAELFNERMQTQAEHAMLEKFQSASAESENFFREQGMSSDAANQLDNRRRAEAQREYQRAHRHQGWSGSEHASRAPVKFSEVLIAFGLVCFIVLVVSGMMGG